MEVFEWFKGIKIVWFNTGNVYWIALYLENLRKNNLIIFNIHSVNSFNISYLNNLFQMKGTTDTLIGYKNYYL